MDDRNLSSHTDDLELAQALFARLPSQVGALRTLLAQIEARLNG